MISAAVATVFLACGALPCASERCDTLIVLATADADVLLPPLTVQNVGTEVTDLIFLKLAEIGNELNTVDLDAYEPRLADQWRRVSPRVWEFSMNPEAEWEDGVPVSPDDVVFSYSVYTDSLVASRFAAQLERIDSVSTIDHSRVRFFFSHEYPEQFYDATQHLRVLPKHILETVPRIELAGHGFGRAPVGNGPYKLTRWETDQFIELVAKDDFFLGSPGIGKIIWRTGLDDATRKLMLVSGEGDVIGTVTGEGDRQYFSETEGVVLLDYPSPIFSFIAFNLKVRDGSGHPHPLLEDTELRRAIAIAVDRETIVGAVFGNAAAVASGPLSRISWLWRDDLVQVPFDHDLAREMLRQKGWSPTGDGSLSRDGERLELDLLVPASSQSRMDAAVIVQAQLAEVGVSVEIVSLEFNAFLEAAQAGDFDMVFSAFLVDPSPSGMSDLWGADGFGGNNWGRYSNIAVDSLLELGAGTASEPAAANYWNRAVDLIVADIPAIWIAEPVMAVAMSDRITSASIRPNQWAANLWRWEID